MSEKTKIAVLISGGGTNLQALIDAERDGKIPDGEIVLVVSNQADAYGLTRAKEAGIPALTVTKEKARRDADGKTDKKDAAEKQEDFERRLLKCLKESGAELIVLAGFLAILGEGFVKQYPERIINIHPSLIPSFCGKGYYGLKVHEAALSYGVKVTGATVHYVNEVPDGGKILLQKAVYIEEGDTAEILQKRVMQEAEWQILPRAAELVAGKIRGEKQEPANQCKN
ncbi:MAG: phosphoribosylglycinamide formyltransferase [Eubacteriales bacterium]|nr:phosphoribosylglycinamide formyltransferase [Eubacteriales bacterium]